jgi:hypothetical protein
MQGESLWQNVFKVEPKEYHTYKHKENGGNTFALINDEITCAEYIQFVDIFQETNRNEQQYQ